MKAIDCCIVHNMVINIIQHCSSHIECVYVLLQVLHTRSCSGVGMHFLHFLSACYMVFSLEYESIAAALASLPPLKTSIALQLGELVY